MGCGDQKVTFWNIKYGYVVASIDISDHRPESSTLWAKSDRVSTNFSKYIFNT